MNCLELRQRVLGNPHDATPGINEHVQGCASCAGFVSEQRAFEQKLISAAQVDVPMHLRDRIVLRQTVHRARNFRQFAYAAGLALVVGSLVGVLTWPARESIAQTVIGHIVAEPDHLYAQSQVDPRTATDVLHRVGLTLRGNLGEIRFAENCPIGRQRGAHLVVAGARGPVTILVLPDTAVTERQAMTSGGFEGVIIPAGRGSLAIVGLPGEALASFEQQLRRAVPQLSETASPRIPPKEA